MPHQKLKSYCMNCSGERMFEYIGDTNNPTQEIYGCEVCGNMRIPPINCDSGLVNRILKLDNSLRREQK